MTTIAYRNKVMAADTAGDRNGIRRLTKKLHVIGSGAEKTIIGFAGNYTDCLVFVEWWRQGHDLQKWPEFRTYRPEDAPDIHALVLQPGRPVMVWNEFAQPSAVLEEFYAIGSGAAAAMAAMHMGADAPEAVRIASLVDFGTGGDVHVERL